MSKSTPSPNSPDWYLGTTYGPHYELEDVVSAVVSFANGDVRPAVDTNVPKLQSNLIGRAGKLVSVTREEAVEDFQRRTKEARIYATNVLATAAAGASELLEFVRPFAEKLIDEAAVALYPTLTVQEGGRATLGWRISGPSQIEEWIRVAALLIATGAGSHGTGICRCQLPSCGRFFRIERKGPGKPSTKYCPGTDHMEQAHRANSTLRSQRKRKADRASAKRGAVRRVAGVRSAPRQERR